MREFVIKALRNYSYRFLGNQTTLLANRLATAYLVRMYARVKVPTTQIRL